MVNYPDYVVTKNGYFPSMMGAIGRRYVYITLLSDTPKYLTLIFSVGVAEFK